MYRRQGIAPEPGPSNNEATTSTEVKVVTRLKRLCHTNQYELDSINSHRQGQLSLFVDPLDDLYQMQKNYAEIVTKALQSNGSSERQQKLACTGEPIGCLVRWLEDIWHVAIDGPEKLRLAYGKNRLPDQTITFHLLAHAHTIEYDILIFLKRLFEAEIQSIWPIASANWGLCL
ncbi:uncharacterized protein EV420DRAFT_1486907 [Desarmillaria tabescens]|uniref:Uncharacterized protein n=1 Tax=Armillaria tabescens TaxID=1929756 RepID=A0AA39J9K6_ARMTA|nr:uncharacterized protein EV420DRAFT_1486907 [Desarmillaria tabescens]KAK0437741.1 hypothetical protein EV420DRAFT_1486907 [Desarmillaria tabescens]